SFAAWSAHRSWAPGSARLPRGPMTTVASACTYVMVAAAGREQPTLEDILTADTVHHSTRRGSTIRSGPAASSVEGRAMSSRRHRDRHGRGLRSPLHRADVPARLTRAESFARVAAAEFARMRDREPGLLNDVVLAIDAVPPASSTEPS